MSLWVSGADNVVVSSLSILALLLFSGGHHHQDTRRTGEVIQWRLVFQIKVARMMQRGAPCG